MLTPLHLAGLLAGLLAAPQAVLVIPQSPEQGGATSQGLVRLQDGEAFSQNRFFVGSEGRAWIGVEIDVSASDRVGLGVASVVEGSPAERAGVETGDRLLALDGQALSSYDELIDRLGDRHPGEEVQLGLQHELDVPLDDRGWKDGGPRLGVYLDVRESDAGTAVVVSRTVKGWPAEAAGLRQGDRIVRAGDTAVESEAALQGALAKVEPGHAVHLVVRRRVPLTLGRNPAELGAPSATPFPDGNQLFGLPGKGDEDPWQGRLIPRNVPQVPNVPWRLTPQPMPEPENMPRSPELSELRSEVRALTDEVRALREELGRLREDLRGLHAGGAR